MREEYMIERQGKRFVLYAGLRDEAHNRGLRSIETELVQGPSKENGEVAIVQAVIRTEEGKFGGVGDGIGRFEEMVGKPVGELTREEASEWIGRLSGRAA